MIKPADLQEAQRQAFLVDYQDLEKFAPESLSIRNQAGNKVAMVLSPGQIKLNKAIEKQRRAGLPVRLVILKTRRSYFTSGVCARMFQHVTSWPYRRGTIVADHYDPAAVEAFDYLAQYQKYYRPFTRFGATAGLPRLLRPRKLETPVSAGSKLEMQWSNGSAVDVMSADSGNVGRGGGRHWLLCDEVGFWRAAGTTLTAALQMVPKVTDTAVFVQSTANGLGGDFYDLCMLSQDPENESGWLFVFFGWLEHPFYQMEPANPAKLQATLNKEEKTLQGLYGATLAQLQWRRHTIATECRGSLEAFHQEYPTTAEEAFISSGRPVFAGSDLALHKTRPGTSGELSVREEGPVKRLIFLPGDVEQGAVTVWKRPEKGRLYVCGADPSEGKDVSTAKRGANPDYSVGFMIEQHTGEQVALLRARSRPGAFAEYLALFCKWFNWAFLVPEANSAGFIDAIIRSGYPLERCYNRQRRPHDRKTDRIEELGFYTDGPSREWLIGAAEDAVRTLSITVVSPVVVSELQTFVIRPDGKKEHAPDRHDDCVISLALAEIGRRVAPAAVRMVETETGWTMDPRPVRMGTKPRPKWMDDDDRDVKPVRTRWR